jgi:hypothetical protein
MEGTLILALPYHQMKGFEVKMANEESCQEDNKNWGVQNLNIKFYLDDLEVLTKNKCLITFKNGSIFFACLLSF